MSEQITKDMFDDYELVRQSGICNMMDIGRVMDLTGLTKPQCLAIMKDYAALREKFGGDA
jgi:hypothetical protein